MDFLFYRISLRSSEDMGKNSMLTMPVTILGVIDSLFIGISLNQNTQKIKTIRKFKLNFLNATILYNAYSNMHRTKLYTHDEKHLILAETSFILNFTISYRF